MGRIIFFSPTKYQLRTGLLAVAATAVYWLVNSSDYPITSTFFIVPTATLSAAVLIAFLALIPSIFKPLEKTGLIALVPLLNLLGLGTVFLALPLEQWGLWWILGGWVICQYGLVLSISFVTSFVLFSLIALAKSDTGESAFVYTLIVSLLVAVIALTARSHPKDDSDAQGKSANKLSIDERIDPKLLLESIADGIVAIDRDGVIRVFNSAAEAITGWQADEAIGLEHTSVIVLLDEEKKQIKDNSNIFHRVLSGGEVPEVNIFTLKSKTGKEATISVNVSPIRENKQQAAAVIGIFRDITAEKQQEKQRAEFISTASHEMRTPVAAIEGYLALALNDRVAKIDSKAREYLDKAHISTLHLGKLFQDLLTAAKSEDGRLTCNPVVMEIGKFLDEIIEAERFATEKKGLIMEDATKGAGDASISPLIYVQADPDRLREVITNIVDNAIKYTDEGKITIQLSSDEQQVKISVTDTGPGISPEDIPHLFQKFYRVDNSITRQIGGTGLGLFISKKIVELFKGRIWAESELGKGSTFSISLPRLSSEQVESMLRQQEAQQIIMPS